MALNSQLIGYFQPNFELHDLLRLRTDELRMLIENSRPPIYRGVQPGAANNLSRHAWRRVERQISTRMYMLQSDRSCSSRRPPDGSLVPMHQLLCVPTQHGMYQSQSLFWLSTHTPRLSVIRLATT